MNKFFKLKIFANAHCIICLEKNNIRSISGNKNKQAVEAEFKIIVKHLNHMQFV